MKVWVVYDVKTELPVCVADTLAEASLLVGYSQVWLFECCKHGTVVGGKYTVSRVDLGDMEEEEDDGGNW